MSDPLASLLVDGNEVDRAAIASAIKDRVAIDKSTGRPVLLEAFNDLDARRKVLLVLLASKAAHLLKLVDQEATTYKDVVATSGIPDGTVAPALKYLKEKRLVSQDGVKAYFVSNGQLAGTIRYLQDGGTK